MNIKDIKATETKNTQDLLKILKRGGLVPKTLTWKKGYFTHMGIRGSYLNLKGTYETNHMMVKLGSIEINGTGINALITWKVGGACNAVPKQVVWGDHNGYKNDSNSIDIIHAVANALKGVSYTDLAGLDLPAVKAITKIKEMNVEYPTSYVIA